MTRHVRPPDGGYVVEFVQSSQVFTGEVAVDEPLRQRLRVALLSDRGTLNRSVRIALVESGSGWAADYLALVDTLGSGEVLVAGWWRGLAAGVVPAAGPPDSAVPLESGTDLDLVVWTIRREQLEPIIGDSGEPTLLATAEPGWVLVSPPAADDLFLYPEVSASGG